MGVTVRIAFQLRGLTHGEHDGVFEGETVADVWDGLDAAYPSSAPRRFDESGTARLRQRLVAADDGRVLHGVHARVASGQLVTILPTVAGG